MLSVSRLVQLLTTYGIMTVSVLGCGSTLLVRTIYVLLIVVSAVLVRFVSRNIAIVCSSAGVC